MLFQGTNGNIFKVKGRICFYHKSVIGLHPHVGQVPLDGSKDPLSRTVPREFVAKVEYTVHVIRGKNISN